MSDLQKINEWSRRIHEWAVGKGWWKDGIESRDIDEIVANFHSEVSEAWEEYRAGRMDLWWFSKSTIAGACDLTIPHANWNPNTDQPLDLIQEGWKPEGFWVEITDLCIRVMDTMAAYQIGLHGIDWHGDESLKPATFICRLHQHIANWLNDQQARTQDILSLCLTIATKSDVDLWSLIELKHRYNETRPYRHGNKKA